MTKSPLYIEKRIYLLCRCTKRQYAEDLFYKGNLFFNYPVNWVAMGSNGKEGQGDPCEGVYSNVITQANKRLRGDSEVVCIKGKHYLRSKSIIENWPCVCFYGAGELTEGRKVDRNMVYDMAKDYISSFCDGETFQTMLEKPLQERMSMVVICHTGKFMNRLRSFFDGHGLIEHKDYYLHSVNYRKEVEPFLIENAPYELLSKDSKYRKQQEFRIILNPYNPKVQELLSGGQIINIGPLMDCAELKTNFYNGATIKVDVEKKKLTIDGVNWMNWAGPLNEINLEAVLPIMQLAYHTTRCEMDGKQMGIDAFWREMANVLAWKYKIELRLEPYDDNKDDHYLFICHGDSYEEIVKNERMDTYYYIKEDNSYKAPFFQKLLGGYPSGVAKISVI